MEPFYGTVNLAHWIKHTDGQQYNCVTGIIEIKDASDVWGFKIGRSESSWVVVIAGNKETAYIPGQEVYAVTHHSQDKQSNHDALVLE